MNKKIIKSLFFLLSLIFLFCPQVYGAESLKLLQKTKILYVPLDDRPVNLAYVEKTMEAVPVQFQIVPRSYLGHRQEVAQIDKLWQWVFSNSNKADVVVLSADNMIYGGLVSSRRHFLTEALLGERVENFRKLKKMHPRTKIYAFSTIMRSPKQSLGFVEPDYYETYGNRIFQITSLQYKKESTGLSSGEEKKLASLLTQVPPEFLADWQNRRAKNLEVNRSLIRLVKGGVIDYFVLCRDDNAVYSQSSKEYQHLSQEARELLEFPAHSLRKYVSFNGADEVGMVLLARALNLYRTPKVLVRYAEGVGEKTIPSYEDQPVGINVDNHIFAAGGVPVDSDSPRDLILAVNTPWDGIVREAAGLANTIKDKRSLRSFVTLLQGYLDAGERVSLADISFVNGADNALLEQLSKKRSLPQLTAYAGWNTAGNSIGYALGQGLIGDLLPPKERESLLAVRLLDDWAYQANVRQEIKKDILAPAKISPWQLGAQEAMITAQTKQKIWDFSRSKLADFPLQDLQITYPWNRLFEINVEIKK